MLSDALKKDIILAVEQGENNQDFLLNHPIPNTDLAEYETFWHDVARVTHRRPTPISPTLETPLMDSETVGYQPNQI